MESGLVDVLTEHERPVGADGEQGGDGREEEEKAYEQLLLGMEVRRGWAWGWLWWWWWLGWGGLAFSPLFMAVVDFFFFSPSRLVFGDVLLGVVR